LVLVGVLVVYAFGAEKKTTEDQPPSAASLAGLRWIAFPDPQLELRGLPWFKENAPELWRMPQSAKAAIPVAVWRRGVAPDGGRIRFASTTARLAVRVQNPTGQARSGFIDAYIGDRAAGSARATGAEPAEILLFEQRDRARKNITIYLPHNQEIRLLAVGIDAGADLKPAPAFAVSKPIVCYGSSVLQGTGSLHPATTYPAALARRLNLDFVNLGFGGAGKAEPAVVALVNQLEASCFLFDLGKSYGDQPADAYVRMLATIRAAHPRVPILCVTPIYSTREPTDAAYYEKSERLRGYMRNAALEMRKAGDEHVHVVEGLDLFGEPDKQHFRDPQHPNDEGNEIIARRLVPLVEKVVLGRK
jgi:hypothetical protein